METYGKLIVRVFVNATKPDEHGRVKGNWRTLRTWWLERDDVDQALAEFYEANPILATRNAWTLDTKFVIEEHISMR